MDFIRSMPSSSRQTQRHLKAVIDEPLEGCVDLVSIHAQNTAFGYEPVRVPIMTIRTGRPFHKPLKPMLPYILDIAWAAPSPAK